MADPTATSTFDPAPPPPDLGPDDAALMRGIAGRDEAALAALYDRYGARLNGLLVRVLGDRTEAEEVLVELFYEVWDRADRYDPTRGCVTTYLMTLARSRAIDRRRRRAARPDSDPARTRPVDPADATTAAVPAASPLAGVLFDEQAAAVRVAMAALDPVRRQAIELAFFDGLSHTEVADVLGRPLGTVKTWIRQGLMTLRDAMGTDDAS